MTRTLKATLAGVAVLGFGLMAYSLTTSQSGQLAAAIMKDNAVPDVNILSDPSSSPSPGAHAWLQQYVRENGRLPPIHHGQTTIIPGNPFKETGDSGGGS